MTNDDPITDRPECAAAIDALQRLLDGDPAADTPVAAAHRGVCVKCREEWALASVFPVLPAPDASPALAGRIWTATRADRRRRRGLRFAGAGLSLAASIVVAVFAFTPPQRVVEDSGRMQLAVAVVPPEPKKPLGESMTEARDALVALTRRAANDTRDQSTRFVPDPKMPQPNDPADKLEPLADARTGASRSVEPVTTSARRAFNLFLRAADPPERRANP